MPKRPKIPLPHATLRHKQMLERPSQAHPPEEIRALMELQRPLIEARRAASAPAPASEGAPE